MNRRTSLLPFLLATGCSSIDPAATGGPGPSAAGVDGGSGQSSDGGPGSAVDGGPQSSSGGPDGGASASPDGGGGAGCKRGIAANILPGAAFAPSATSPGVAWWYNWAKQSPGTTAGIEFVPMIWGKPNDLNGSVPAGSRYVLGFNEPNFKAQANLTAEQAAASWPKVEAQAKGVGAAIVSPAMNFCGSAQNNSQCSAPTVTDPYTYLKKFFAACAGCQVDYVAVHWYNCDLPSLKAYIEGNGSLEGFVQFNKPIWLTEFSCGGGKSVAEQKAYMEAAIPYLEQSPHVHRYSWFSATPIPNARLVNEDGSPTDLGKTYIALPQTCTN